MVEYLSGLEAVAEHRNEDVRRNGVLQEDGEADKFHSCDRALVLPRLGSVGAQLTLHPGPHAAALSVLADLGAPFERSARRDDQTQADQAPEV